MAEKMANIKFRINIADLESILNYSFNNKNLLEEILGGSYHRLEFLGDAVLEFLIAINIYSTSQNVDKKALIRVVEKNVENGVLGRAAIKHGFHNILLCEPLKDRSKIQVMIDKSELDADVKPPKFLANIIESIAGAVNVDSEFSFDKVWKVFRPLLNPLLGRETLKHKMESHKNSCQEHNTKEYISTNNHSPSESGVTKETPTHSVNPCDSSKQKLESAACNCNEVRKVIQNTNRQLHTPSYKSNVLDEIEEKLNYNFKSRNFLIDSYCKSLEILTLNAFKGCNTCTELIELRGLKSHKCMEFLGHLVLKQAITKYLYITYPDLQPGMLTTLRSNIMDNEKLARVAIVKLQVHKHLSFGNKSFRDKVSRLIEDIINNCKDVNPPLILCNMVKSIAGAMFLDSSGLLLENSSSAMEKVWEKFKILLEPLASEEIFERNPVQELNELCQKYASHRIEYKDHKYRVWEEEMAIVEVFIDDKMVGRGENVKKAVAKRIAARSAREYFKSKIKAEEI